MVRKLDLKVSWGDQDKEEELVAQIKGFTDFSQSSGSEITYGCREGHQLQPGAGSPRAASITVACVHNTWPMIIYAPWHTVRSPPALHLGKLRAPLETGSQSK